jgi:hypothetical protein
VIKETVNVMSRVVRYAHGIANLSKVPQILREFVLSLDSPIEETRNNIMFILTAVGTWMGSEEMFQYD